MLRARPRCFSAAAAAPPAAPQPFNLAAVKPSPIPPRPGGFDKILISNRGEISVRVQRTAKRMGIKTVAIYSDPDANAQHVKLADEAVCVGPAPSAQSYLSVPRILEAIRRTGAQGVHPGYGFLSENAGFSRTLEEAGVKFIGPRAHSMEAMGDKIRSKEFALAAGVSTIPGFLGVLADEAEAVAVSRRVGYPVMIKASAGGGGKGMRIARSDAEAAEGFRLSRAEAASSFGDDRLFVEKFIEQPRHIEIQLIADAHGNVVALPERECSIQRRNQKVIEESPSVLLSPATRAAMQAQACALARAVGYESAGTVEFLADAAQNFYFLEMNTRLQVEHPVTEAVTGLDLVELMLRVAAGERLPTSLTGAPVPFLGHAFEARVYAEDPLRGFLPSTGRLSRYVEPQQFRAQDAYLAGGAIRADSGVQQGSDISMFYDPMICKLVTHAPSRAGALDLLRASLDAYVIRGVGHNVAFLRDLAAHPRFVEGALTTQFIGEEYPQGFQGVALARCDLLRVAAGAAIMHALREAMYAGGGAAGAPAGAELVVTLGAAEGKDRGPAFAVSLRGTGTASGCDWVAEVGEVGAAAAPTPIALNNVQWAVEAPIMFAQLPQGSGGAGAGVVEPPSEGTLRLQHLARTPSGFSLLYKGATVAATVRTPAEHALGAHMKAKAKRDTSKALLSPMPGRLVSVAVKAGDAVELGQELAVVEVRAAAAALASSPRAHAHSTHSHAPQHSRATHPTP